MVMGVMFPEEVGIANQDSMRLPTEHSLHSEIAYGKAGGLGDALRMHKRRLYRP
jgi:hypothetical protein